MKETQKTKKFSATRKRRVQNGKYYFRTGKRKERNDKKNFEARETRNGKIVKLYWKILEYNAGSLKARRGKNIVWEDKEVGQVIFFKQNRKIAGNGMREIENAN